MCGKDKEMEYTKQELDYLKKMASSSKQGVANKCACICQTVLCTILMLAYVLEGIKGSRTMGYILVTVLLSMVPVAVSWYFYKQNRSCPNAIMRTVGIGFTLLYTFLLFTANNNLVFTYVLAMLLVLLMFSKMRFIVIIGVGAALENIIDVIYLIAKGHKEPADIVTYEIQVLLVILAVVFFIVVSWCTNMQSEIRQARLTMESKKISDLLKEVLNISENVAENVSQVDDMVGSLNESMGVTLSAMSEVSEGTNETAQTIQNQLVKTEEIQDYISSVEESTSVIADNMETTSDAINKGQKQIDNLMKLTEISDRAGNEVATALNSFKETTGQMNSITELINSVASQTSLLALNASIEAARAGEAGKGFAVVASEISNLANQTTSATEDINSLIAQINAQLGNMVETIGNLIKSNEEQSMSADETAKEFAIIISNINNIKTESENLEDIVVKLAKSNKEIVDSIQTVSAITQQVSSHSSETYSASEGNQGILNQVRELVDVLSENAQRLRSTN